MFTERWKERKQTSYKFTVNALLEVFLRINFFSENHTNTRTITNKHVFFLPDLRRYFQEPPYSQSVPLEQHVELRCLPPVGRPQPTATWLKDNVPIDLEKHPSYK